MSALEEMVVELESSVVEIERNAPPEFAGWLAAHRKRLASLRLALAGSHASESAPPPVEGPTDMKAAMRAHKRSLVERALGASAGDNVAAARLLGVHPKYLYQLIRELDLPGA